ncbi:tyrosine-type recombinase/integrase [Hassallia byssoidea VB512170]|uniref:Tyrosine-type recombinase/integrase n=1 Tax=Hassallia byssoidea VB512170 TaxID=1304833 RepID=A0A846HGE5_9CYAN|nr:tyrosine-type recombinase/integrase [Hassalia byssoidea]NEU75461.1 tyrosine-type recombinase/integrase [Hassalia byssoidea VB512170]
MKVQRVRLPNTDSVTWTVLGDDYLPIRPIEQFISYLESIERSPNTIRAYAHHLKLYWEFLRDTNRDWTKIKISDLAEFISYLRQPQVGVLSLQPQEARRTETTVNVIITSVCVLYDYQERLGTVKEIPIYSQMIQGRQYKSFLHHINKSKPVKTKLIKLKEPKRIPKTLTQEQVTGLITACDRFRDKFLIFLLYETGMRIGQALGLRHSDIKSWDNLIKIVPRCDNANGARAKTKEEYNVHVTKELMEFYSRYLLGEFNECDSDYVFINLWDGVIGQPMKYPAVADLFRRLSKKTGIKFNAHMMRHTHGTELARSGWDASYIQKRLGHSDVQTTIKTYINLNDDDLKEAYKEYLDKPKK